MVIESPNWELPVMVLGGPGLRRLPGADGWNSVRSTPAGTTVSRAPESP